MRQYFDAKRQYRDAIVFFRMGDFYEMFYEDALVAARALDLTLTSRSKDTGGAGIPMCGVPFHAVDGYLAKLVGKGFRVAMCEQVEDPKKAKGLVKREVVRVVSPGTLTDAKYLEAREPAYLMAIVSTATERTREDEEVLGVALSLQCVPSTDLRCVLSDGPGSLRLCGADSGPCLLQARASAARPGAVSRRCTKASADARRGASRTTATTYSITGCAVAGIAMDVTSSPAGPTSVKVAVYVVLATGVEIVCAAAPPSLQPANW